MDYDKLSPALAAALDTFRAEGPSGLMPQRSLLGLVSLEPVPKPARMVVFLHCDEDAVLDDLAGEGVEVNSPRGRVRTGIVPFESLESVAGHDGVRRIVPARRLQPMMDVAGPKVGLPALRRRTGLRGQGVVIGVVDTGIEPVHPSFDGRILRTWDQTLSGPGVPEGGYGAELTGPLLKISRDTNGHGTHVAGIAASADDTFEGVAPEAELVIVRTDLLTAHIADGVRYVFRVAAELGRPAVVNLSLGGHGDAHDGTDSLSAIVDSESGPGRIVCCAAGNEGTDNIHARVTLRQGRTSTIPLAVPPPTPGRAPAFASLNGWYSGDDEVEVAVASPSGAQTPFQPMVSGGSPVRVHRLPDGAVRVTTPGPDPANGDHNFLVDIQPSGQGVSMLRSWRLRLRATRLTDGRVDVWSIDPSSAQFTGPPVHDAVKIGAPGAASQAVTVASYTTRVDWVDVLGNPQQAGLDVDDISDFSSEGPRRDGVEKPDLAAPGAMIVSAFSSHAPTELAMLVDDRHTVMAGTSMACPFVAGLVALLLERDPGLGPDQVKEMLRNRSSLPGRPQGTFDPQWGYGLIDAGGL